MESKFERWEIITETGFGTRRISGSTRAPEPTKDTTFESVLSVLEGLEECCMDSLNDREKVATAVATWAKKHYLGR